MTTTEPQHDACPTGTPTRSTASAALRLPLSAGFFSTEVAAHLGLSRFVLLGFAASIAANVLLSAALLFKTPPQTVVVVPPEAGFSGDMGVSLQTAYRVDENGPDARLLERTAMTLIQMIATVTPETGRTQIARSGARRPGGGVEIGSPAAEGIEEPHRRPRRVGLLPARSENRAPRDDRHRHRPTEVGARHQGRHRREEKLAAPLPARGRAALPHGRRRSVGRLTAFPKPPRPETSKTAPIIKAKQTTTNDQAP